ncbi:hypothetical protein [Roseiterribacter gracilis]|uniref:Uncharacterized protein n=1 Tax=Roseiterribacter gracilis TaxID=2812848 RepID=A0A8S8X8P6_9PROT|nr:hypothetical protein TMPK1_12910 [Rhodospirillales bacterium TMPK1]
MAELATIAWNSVVLERVGDSDGERVQARLAMDGRPYDDQVAFVSFAAPNGPLTRESIFGDKKWRLALALQQEIFHLAAPGLQLPIYIGGTAHHLRSADREAA